MDTLRKPPRRILIIEGHPDPSPQRLCHALAEAYREGAREAGHTLRTLILGDLDIPLLTSRSDWESPRGIVEICQQDLLWAEHVVVIYPLWLGDVPAVLKAFLEQVLRPDLRLIRSVRPRAGCSRGGPRGWSSPWACRAGSISAGSARTASEASAATSSSS
ncbi:NAD(P)H-dependent oxidoreductase [Brevundimonas denitrificans]|uniref:NAD(P)H-dependent oxidoreductase n=1 Tax=Brevundimonas denitrificans TaxID=1443434 RepID=UPI00352F45D6